MSDDAPPPAAPMRMLDVVRIAASAFGLTRAGILSRTHCRRPVRARHCAMGLIRHGGIGLAGAPASLPAIGRLFGGFDHTTVLHGIRAYARWCGEMGVDPVPGEGIARRAEAVAAHLGFAVPVGTAPPDDGWAPLDVVVEGERGGGAKGAGSASVGASLLSASPAPAVPFPLANEDDMNAAKDKSMSEALDRHEPEAFGRFALAPQSLAALPPAMQAEAARLALERVASDAPQARDAGLARRAARMLGVSPEALLDLARGSPPPFAMHELSPQSGGAEIEAEVPGRGRDAVPAVSDADRFTAFARVHLSPDGRFETSVPSAFAAYRRHCRRVGDEPTSRANFGARLLAFAKAHGGVRSGDTITAIALLEPAAVPAAERIVAVRPKQRFAGWPTYVVFVRG